MAECLSRILITGGAGFVGSTIAVAFKRQFPGSTVVAFDNLRRRGSELILERLRANEVGFVHGDIRCRSDFPAEEFDLLVECSAEPSVLAGYTSRPDYLIETNLTGAYHCLEFCRTRCPRMIFISTSRVYSVPALAGLRTREIETRFELTAEQEVTGVSEFGVSESFPTTGPRSLYGATKLAAEMLIEEYRHAYGIRAVVDRCGVLAGPWQMGKGDQGIFTFWLASHYFKRPLRYIGFGGLGKQVRDLLHADDLADLVIEQAGAIPEWDGAVLNVGGGLEISLSLRETTKLCAELTGQSMTVGEEAKPRPMDIPIYLSDCRALFGRSAWRPKRGPREILGETLEWIRQHEAQLRNIL